LGGGGRACTRTGCMGIGPRLGVEDRTALGQLCASVRCDQERASKARPGSPNPAVRIRTPKSIYAPPEVTKAGMIVRNRPPGGEPGRSGWVFDCVRVLFGGGNGHQTEQSAISRNGGARTTIRPHFPRTSCYRRNSRFRCAIQGGLQNDHGHSRIVALQSVPV